MPNSITQNLTRLTNATTNIANAITYGGGTTLGRLEGFPNEINTRFNTINSTIESLLTDPTPKWTKFRNKVRAGTAESEYPIGTILYDDWDNENSTAFRIVDYDHHFDADLTALGYSHSVTLLEEYISDYIEYDSPEAFLYLTSPLVAGTYYFVYYPYGSTKSYCYQFTTTADVPVGGQLVRTSNNIEGYSSNTSTTPLFTVPYSSVQWASGNNIGPLYDDRTGNNSYGNINTYGRALDGSNNYYQSNIRDFLNTVTSTNWYIPQTIFDRPPTVQTNSKLSKLDNNFVSVLASPNLTTLCSNITTPSLDGTTFTSGGTYNIKDKLFLLSPKEVGFDYNTSIGTTLSYYMNVDNSVRIKYDITNKTSAKYWRLRTPVIDNSQSISSVSYNGAYFTVGSYYSVNVGCACACVIQ